MRYRLMIVCFLVAVTTACGQIEDTVSIEPLPTAIGPVEEPPNIESGSWAIPFEHPFPAGFWGPGVHRYSFYVHCPVVFQEDIRGEWVLFESSNEAVLQMQPMYLRLAGISSGILSAVVTDIIHPDQEMVAVVTLAGLSENVLPMIETQCTALIAWDDKGTQVLTAGEPFQP